MPIPSTIRCLILSGLVLACGCGDDAETTNLDGDLDSSSFTFGRSTSSDVPAEPLSETDQLIVDLVSTLQTLQQNEPEILNALKQYRVELAQQTANLRSSLARSGKTLVEVRSAGEDAATPDITLVRMKRHDRRCSELRIYIDKLTTARGHVRLLIEDHQYVLTDLQTRQRVDKLVDSGLLTKARDLLQRAGDQNSLSPQKILEDPELVVAMVKAQKQTAEAISHSILPARPETKLDDLAALPTLEFTADGQALTRLIWSSPHWRGA